VGRSALLAYLLAIVYASLNPFIGWRAPEAFSLFTWPRYLNDFDIAINVLAYVPLGGMLAAVQFRAQRLGHRGSVDSPSTILLRVTITGFLLSAALESLQTLLPVRVASPVDLLANTAGTFVGAALVVSRLGRRQLAGLLRWRHRHFSLGDTTSWGLLLLGAWFVAQLNPVIPFFEAGHIANPFDTAAAQSPYEPIILLPQAVGITLNVCGFALFVSLLLHQDRRGLFNVMFILVLGFLLKVSAASLMLKAPQMTSWLGPATVIGLTSGLILFAYFSRIEFRWRAFCATLFIFAGGLMAKITSIYGAFDESLRLLNWPYGHLSSFTGLTRWIHEVWPLLAILFAAWIFVRRHHH
jgi:VanZ family protein